jgi:hypothetical protein
LASDDPGATAMGADINFVEIEDNIRFELNQSNSGFRELKAAASLILANFE